MTVREQGGSTPSADAGPDPPVVPSAHPAPTTRGCGGPPEAGDDGLGQQLRLANWMINRVFQISLELHVAAMEDGHSCALFDGVLEDLDRLIFDVRREVFASHPSREREANDPATEIAGATRALDAALRHLESPVTRRR
jgi:hypothetical protein